MKHENKLILKNKTVERDYNANLRQTNHTF